MIAISHTPSNANWIVTLSVGVSQPPYPTGGVGRCAGALLWPSAPASARSATLVCVTISPPARVAQGGCFVVLDRFVVVGLVHLAESTYHGL